MDNIKCIGIDLAKNIFHLHGVDINGKEIFKKKLSRKKLIEFINNLDCQRDKVVVGMEGCSGANYFAKKFRSFGYDARVVAAQFVKPYIKSNKNDFADALAITKAVLDPDMRFCNIREDWQQDIMSIHRVRSRLIKQRTALGNEIRGSLAEYGITSAQTISKLKKKLAIELNSDNLNEVAKMVINSMFEELMFLEQRIDKVNSMLKEVFAKNKLCQKLIKIPGIGLITSTALVGELGNAANFKNGRELSAYLGLVPKQNSSGGKNKLLGISKRGNKYLRTLLTHGARAILQSLNRSKDINSNKFYQNKKLGNWFLNLKLRKNTNIAVTALANKLARICFAVLNKEQEYTPSYGY